MFLAKYQNSRKNHLKQEKATNLYFAEKGCWLEWWKFQAGADKQTGGNQS